MIDYPRTTQVEPPDRSTVFAVALVMLVFLIGGIIALIPLILNAIEGR